jgi:hypothetical protein
MPEIVDLHDVLVVEEGGELGLVDEGGDEFLLLREMGEDLLDGDELLESLDPDDFRPVQVGHAAGGLFFQKEVLPESDRLVWWHRILVARLRRVEI